jgi:hypothetical protein
MNASKTKQEEVDRNFTFFQQDAFKARAGEEYRSPIRAGRPFWFFSGSFPMQHDPDFTVAHPCRPLAD